MILGLTDAAVLAALLLTSGTSAPAALSGALLGSAPPPVLDRYGAPAPSPPPDVAPPSWRSGRRLVWPGKTPPPDAAVQPPAALDAPKDAATALTGVPASAPIAAAPASPAAAPPERRVDGPRFYSLHRDYGLAPDAIPLPPKFFGPTADLSKPPEPAIIRLGDTRPALTAQSADDAAGERIAAP